MIKAYLEEVFSERETVGYPEWLWLSLKLAGVCTGMTFIEERYSGYEMLIYSVRKSRGMYYVSGLSLDDDGCKNYELCDDYDGIYAAVSEFINCGMESELKAFKEELASLGMDEWLDAIESFCYENGYSFDEFVELDEVEVWVNS